MAIILEGDPAIHYLDGVLKTAAKCEEADQNLGWLKHLTTLTQIQRAFLLLQASTTENPHSATLPLALYGLPSLGYWLASVDQALQEYADKTKLRVDALDGLLQDLAYQPDAVPAQISTRTQAIASSSQFNRAMSAITTDALDEIRENVDTSLSKHPPQEDVHDVRYVDGGHLLLVQEYLDKRKKQPAHWETKSGVKYISVSSKAPAHSLFLRFEVYEDDTNDFYSSRFLPNTSSTKRHPEALAELSKSKQALYRLDEKLALAITHHGTKDSFVALAETFDFTPYSDQNAAILDSIATASQVVHQIKTFINKIKEAGTPLEEDKVTQLQLSWAQTLGQIYQTAPEPIRPSLQAACQTELSQIRAALQKLNASPPARSTQNRRGLFR